MVRQYGTLTFDTVRRHTRFHAHHARHLGPAHGTASISHQVEKSCSCSCHVRAVAESESDRGCPRNDVKLTVTVPPHYFRHFPAHSHDPKRKKSHGSGASHVPRTRVLIIPVESSSPTTLQEEERVLTSPLTSVYCMLLCSLCWVTISRLRVRIPPPPLPCPWPPPSTPPIAATGFLHFSNKNT